MKILPTYIVHEDGFMENATTLESKGKVTYEKRMVERTVWRGKDSRRVKKGEIEAKIEAVQLS